MTEHDPSAWLASIAEIFDRLGEPVTATTSASYSNPESHLDDAYLTRWVAEWELADRGRSFAADR